MKKLMLIVAGCVAALLMTGCGAKGPGDTFKAAAEKIKAKDWGAAYDIMSERAHKETDEGLQAAAAMAGAMGDSKEAAGFKKLAGLKGRELFVAFMKLSTESGKEAPDLDAEVVNEVVTGDKAKITIKSKAGKTEELDMIKEGGSWKIDAPPGGSHR